jgi:hypothetical protein
MLMMLMLFMFVVCLVVTLSLFTAAPALAVWTPLIASSDFTGIQTDVLTACAGILAVMLVIVGVGLLIRILGR